MAKGYSIEQIAKEKELKARKSLIIKAYQKNLPRLRKLFIEAGELRINISQRNELIRKLRNMYSVVFRGLTSKKKMLDITNLETNKKYSITPVGFAIKPSIYSINSASISGLQSMEFIKEIQFIASKLENWESSLKKEGLFWKEQ